ncbi:hypothetical protein [Rhodoplanes azumiensis]|uniref:Uncharacterized protein n=1 Tax=Rhodoplanes azumiensis TaxID=1897628 RepID=A0ABW5AI34_9BRAD
MIGIAGRVAPALVRTAAVAWVVSAWPAPPAAAQDVRGLEACGRESQMDRRTGCLQANVEYLHAVIARNATLANQRLAAAAAEIAVLKATVATLQATVEKLAAAKSADTKSADTKPGDPKAPESKPPATTPAPPAGSGAPAGPR